MIKKLIEFSIACPLFFLTSCSQIPFFIEEIVDVEKAVMEYEVKKDDKDIDVTIHLDIDKDDCKKE